VCGIGGVFDPDTNQIDVDVAERLADNLRHRGPDRHAVHVEGGVALVATRLAIVDLSPAGDQPRVEGRRALAFNGEIYNHRALRADLEADGISFEGHSDTEVVFQHLARHGPDATVTRLRGMFAFAWWDGETLWLARDRYGIKPLVWTRHGTRLIWASEARALEGVAPLVPDPIQVMNGFLSLADRARRRTCFRDVDQVPPGHLLAAHRDGTIELRRWHRLADEVDPDRYRELATLPFDRLVDELDGLMTDAVGAMLMGDAPTGTFVSGGVDSSLLAALAVSHGSTDDHHLFAADVAYPRSEAPAAARVAEHLGAPLLLAHFEPEGLLTGWAEATRAYEAPLVTHVNSLPYLAVARRARAEGVKSVLTGEGADELFFGYPEAAFRGIRRMLRAPVVALDRAYQLAPGLARRVLPELHDARAGQLAALGEDVERSRQEAEARAAYAFLGERRAAEHASALEMLEGHLLSLLHRNDRVGMATSVESRFPFLDEAVVAFALNLPRSAKVRLGRRLHDRKHPFLVDKAVLRAVAARHLPEEVAHRRKDGFPTVGHEHVRIDPSLFAGGWTADVLRLSAEGIDHICRSEPPIVGARLASVEVFGRIYGHREDDDAVTDLLRRHVHLELG